MAAQLLEIFGGTAPLSYYQIRKKALLLGYINVVTRQK
jgi:hypothetical protein